MFELMFDKFEVRSGWQSSAILLALQNLLYWPQFVSLEVSNSLALHCLSLDHPYVGLKSTWYWRSSSTIVF